MDKVEVYTDGSFLPMSKNGAYASVIVYNNILLELYESETSTTNNKMELKAVIEALKLLKKKCEVVVYSDSTYVVESVRHNKIFEWRKKNFKDIKNSDLWINLIKLLKIHKVRFKKVESHGNNKLNNMCHELAYLAAINMFGRTIKYKEV